MRGTFRQMIGSRKMVPSRMLRMVPFGDRHICLRLNSLTRASSGVMVAHLTATPCFLVAFGRVDRDLVVGPVARLDAEVEVLQVDVEIRKDQRLADLLPDDARHLVAVHLDDGVLHLDLRSRAAPCGCSRNEAIIARRSAAAYRRTAAPASARCRRTSVLSTAIYCAVDVHQRLLHPALAAGALHLVEAVARPRRGRPLPRRGSAWPRRRPRPTRSS